MATGIKSAQLPGGSDYVPGAGTGTSTIQPDTTNPLINTSQPNPNTVNATSISNPTTPTPDTTGQVQGTLPGQTTPTTFTSTDVAKQYGAALQTAKATGPPPQDAASANTAVNSALTANPPPQTPPPAVDNLFNGTSPTLQDSVAQITKDLNPTANDQLLQDSLDKITADKSTLAGLNTQSMNFDNVMSGSQQEIQDEIQKSGGFATQSQILALTGARNQALLTQQKIVQQKIQNAQDAVNNDISLYQNEKDMANTQFAQRSQIYQLAQTNYNNQINAIKDSAKQMITNVGYSGLVNALLNSDPTGTSLIRASQITGEPLQQLATQEKSNNNLALIQASGATSPYVVNAKGEVMDTSTGYTYTSQADFQQKTGMDTGTAGAKGLIKPLGPDIKTATAQANLQKAQQDAKDATAINAANIAQSKASTNNSNISAAKTATELQFMNSHGGLTASEWNAQDKTTQTDVQAIQTDAAALVEKMGTKTGGILGVGAKSMSWGTAWNTMHAKYPELTNDAIDNLLQANKYK